MEDVTLTHMQASDVNRFHYSRQSDHYRPIHRFCRLFLDGFSLSEKAGDSPFDGFLMDMNVLFEQFVAIKLEQHLRGTSQSLGLTRKKLHPMDVGESAEIEPDLVIEHSGRRMVVADTKYKKIVETGHVNSDLYQIITYCTVLGLSHGVLIYPRHEIDFHRQLAIRSSHITIHEVSIDLDGSPEAIDQEFAMLTWRLISLGQIVQSA